MNYLERKRVIEERDQQDIRMAEHRRLMERLEMGGGLLARVERVFPDNRRRLFVAKNPLDNGSLDRAEALGGLEEEGGLRHA